jgi:uncharacterized membrane protein YccC
VFFGQACARASTTAASRSRRIRRWASDGLRRLRLTISLEKLRSSAASANVRARRVNSGRTIASSLGQLAAVAYGPVGQIHGLHHFPAKPGRDHAQGGGDSGRGQAWGASTLPYVEARGLRVQSGQHLAAVSHQIEHHKVK